MKNKYSILIDGGREGYSIHDTKYDTIEEAVKEGIKISTSTTYPFLIIQTIDWEAKEKQVDISNLFKDNNG